MKKITIKKRMTFEAAHHLLNYEGKCKNNHGHSWQLEVEVSATDERIKWNNGMIIDYSILKNFIEENILQYLDHQDINEIKIIEENPTSENLAAWIFDAVKALLNKEFSWGIKLESISLKETENSECIVKEID
jgi:6-pyruvoyltetrahydropterin/6-carboxytetrahydropterin synthase